MIDVSLLFHIIFPNAIPRESVLSSISVPLYCLILYLCIQRVWLIYNEQWMSFKRLWIQTKKAREIEKYEKLKQQQIKEFEEKQKEKIHKMQESGINLSPIPAHKKKNSNIHNYRYNYTLPNQTQSRINELRRMNSMPDTTKYRSCTKTKPLTALAGVITLLSIVGLMYVLF